MDISQLERAAESILLIPGPTPVPGRVLRAQSRPMINHRAPAFRELLRRLTEGLKPCFRTAGEPLILTASGTGGLEAAVVNVLSPGEQVLAGVTGQFGKRFADIAEAYGARVDRLEVRWGDALTPQALAGHLARGGYRAVLLTLNETSTGVVNPIRELASVAREHDALVLVDAISGLLATPCEHDAWGLDITVAGSQKAFMIPPGLTFVAVSERAWEAAATARMPRFYFDLKAARRYLERGENPWTPAVSLLYALDEALTMMQEEGLEAIVSRHHRLRDGVRAGGRALGLVPLAEDDCASPAVTALKLRDGIDASQLSGLLRERYGVELAGGQGELKGRVLRFGHLGYVSEQQVLRGLLLLGQALRELGSGVEPVTAVTVAREAMQAS